MLLYIVLIKTGTGLETGLGIWLVCPENIRNSTNEDVVKISNVFFISNSDLLSIVVYQHLEEFVWIYVALFAHLKLRKQFL